MDSGQHHDYDQNGHAASNEMQVEATTTLGSVTVSTDVEMQAPRTTSDSTAIDTDGTQSGPIGMTLSMSASPSDSSLASSDPTSMSTSSTSQRTSTRRTRVEDDHDEERDRRHPSERVGSPSHPSNTAQASTPSSTNLPPPLPTTAPTPTTTRSPFLGSRLNPLRFFRHMIPSDHEGAPTNAPSDSSTSSLFPPHQQDIATHVPSTSSTSATGGTPDSVSGLGPTSAASASSSQSLPTLHSSSASTPASSSTSNLNGARQQQQQNTPRPDPRGQFIGAFSIMFDVNGGMTTTPLPGGIPPFPHNGGASAPIHSGIPNPGPAPTSQDQASHETSTPADQSGAQPSAQGREQAQNEPLTQIPPSTQPNPAENDARHTQQQPAPPTLPDGAFTELLARMGILAALSMRGLGLSDADVEDPERAKRLVAGLEDVPIGLVQRLERVGKVTVEGEGGEEGMGGLGDGGCAVCWEKLLLEEVEETKKEKEEESKEKEKETGEASSSSSQVETEPNTPTTTTSSTEPSANTSSTSDSTSPSDPHPTSSSSTSTSTACTSLPSSSSETKSELEKKYQRIVSLPCAHVFHAQCLIPWFSKPKQTTCPICRFNIDPENLTYTSRSQRRAAAARTTREPGRQQGQQRDGAAAGVNIGGNVNGTGAGDEGVNRGGDVDDGSDMVEFDIPLAFGGLEPPPFPPMRAREGEPNAHPPHNPTGDGANASEAGNNNDNNPNADRDGNANPGDPRGGDMVTIGFDMYIGRGPPPFDIRGPGVIQIPFLGGEPLPRPSATGNANNANNNGALGGDNANPNPTPAQGDDNHDESVNQGAGGNRNPEGTTFAIPIPPGSGLSRALGEVFTRIFTGGPPPTGTNSGAGAGVPNAGNNAPAGNGPPQEPTLRRPAGFPLPGGVGLGSGAGGGPALPPFVLPFGSRSGNAPAPPNPPQPPPPPQQPATGQTGHGGHTGPSPPTNVDFFDILTGLFGPPPGRTQVRVSEAPPPDAPRAFGPEPPPPAQPAQPQPRRVQNLNIPLPVPPTGGAGGPFGLNFLPGGSPPPRPASAPTPRSQRKTWTPPPAPGLTLRQRVEKREQEAGLRCCDISCGVGPSDEDPWIAVSEHGSKQLSIRSSPPPSSKLDNVVSDSGVDLSSLAAGGTDGEKDVKEQRKSVCPHTFHSSCLVSAERVSLRDAAPVFVGPEGKQEVEVSCPVCRGVGRVSKAEWDAGVEALS